MPLLRGPYNARPPAGAAPHSGGRRRKRAGLELLLRNPLFFLIFAVRVSQKFCRATLAARIEALKKDATTDFMFGTVTREGWKPGEGGDSSGKPAGGKKPSEMSYAELAEYMAANPDAKLD